MASVHFASAFSWRRIPRQINVTNKAAQDIAQGRVLWADGRHNGSGPHAGRFQGNLFLRWPINRQIDRRCRSNGRCDRASRVRGGASDHAETGAGRGKIWGIAEADTAAGRGAGAARAREDRPGDCRHPPLLIPREAAPAFRNEAAPLFRELLAPLFRDDVAPFEGMTMKACCWV